MKKVLIGVLKGAWRLSGPTVVGALFSIYANTPYGLVAIPILKGLSQGYKEYLKNNNKEIPEWFKKLPF